MAAASASPVAEAATPDRPVPAAPGRSAAIHTETWPALGTTALLRYTGSPDPALRAAAEAELDAIDVAASRFRPDSEISRLTPGATAPESISPLLHQAVELALRAAALTDGLVDPTLGAELVALGYDRDWAALDRVDPAARLDPGPRRLLVTRRRRPAWTAVELSDRPPAVRLPAGTRLDLGATAKALAADRAATAAARAAATTAGPDEPSTGVLVALGGDIAIAGPAPADGWAVHVTDDHRAGPDAPGQTIVLRSGGLATSSLMTRRWRAAERVRHHILDPRTGEPVTPVWRTVSVTAATCADANIASTAAIVMGAAAPDWLARAGLPARLVSLDGSVTTVAGWPR